jgi:alpha-tubulin suppressor-like RCC1 family protein
MELGNGGTSNSTTPVNHGALRDAPAVCRRVVDRRQDRKWGSNRGLLGDGTTTDSGTPVRVSGLFHAVAVSIGGSHACAVLANGTVRCWGGNAYGELGSAPSLPSLTPVTVPGLTNVVAVSAGSTHTCAILGNGTVRCWGRNGSGRLGNGSNINSPTPVAVSGLTNVVAISAGASHSCAVLANGTGRCWGDNRKGRLGNGSSAAGSLTPVAVSGLTNAVAISAGGEHSCALLANGSARCWGRNGSGRLGNGSTIDSLTPVVVSGSEVWLRVLSRG